MNIRTVLQAVAVCAFTAARADIAPTQFKGEGITPVDAPGIRMESARVDIEWGTPCVLSAVFVMDNQTAAAVDVQLGFPVSLPETQRDKHALDFRMSFDGVPAAPASITVVGKPLDNFPAGDTWYRCRHAFAPGKTTVAVKTKLPATLDYNWPYRESLTYCIQTGRAWAGSIGTEEVNVRFPTSAGEPRIYETKPGKPAADGNVVRWRFEDFKPRGEDHDVSIEYLRPDVVAELTARRAALARDPGNAGLTLTLARDLFALGCRREVGIGGWLDEKEYQEITGRIRDDKDRARFASWYSKREDGRHRAKDSEWTKEYNQIRRIVSETDYVPPSCRLQELREARELIEHLLEVEPHNAEAWNVYLGNFGKFRPYGDEFFPAEVGQIEAAYRSCPDDPCICLWHERAKLGDEWSARHGKEAGQAAELSRRIIDRSKKAGSEADTFRHIDYGYW